MSLVETLPTPETATWCEDGVVGDGTPSVPGDVDPSGGDIADGWPDTEEPIARQRLNWYCKLVHRVTRYLRQRGVPDYHADETYPPGARVTGGDGQTYAWTGAGNTKGVAPGGANAWKRWGHFEDQIQTLIDDTIGDVSGTLAEGTIAASNNGVVSYRRKLCFPDSTDKIVCARVDIHKDVSGNWITTLTLSGAATFANGATGAVATLASMNGNDGWPLAIQAEVLSETTVKLYYPNNTGTVEGSNPLTVEVQIRGN